jgi:hypothetical protein
MHVAATHDKYTCVHFCMLPMPCSFENLSSGDGALVIDLTSLAGVSVDLGSNTATIQMGTRHGNMYNAITTAGRAAGRPGLTCLGGVWPQVGQVQPPQLQQHLR